MLKCFVLEFILHFRAVFILYFSFLSFLHRIFALQGQDEGSMYVTVSPCLANGQALDEESFIEEPEELLGKPYYFKVR